MMSDDNYSINTTTPTNLNDDDDDDDLSSSTESDTPRHTSTPAQYANDDTVPTAAISLDTGLCAVDILITFKAELNINFESIRFG